MNFSSFFLCDLLQKCLFNKKKNAQCRLYFHVNINLLLYYCISSAARQLANDTNVLFKCNDCCCGVKTRIKSSICHSETNHSTITTMCSTFDMLPNEVTHTQIPREYYGMCQQSHQRNMNTHTHTVSFKKPSQSIYPSLTLTVNVGQNSSRDKKFG